MFLCHTIEAMNTMTIDVAAYLTMKQDLDKLKKEKKELKETLDCISKRKIHQVAAENDKLKKENEKLTQRLEDKEDPDSWWESEYYECRDELHEAHVREAKLKCENEKLEKDNDKLEKEVSVLLAVASGDYNRADDFKALCKERFEEEFIDACDDDTLVGQYFTE